jgi:hypothetical protein
MNAGRDLGTEFVLKKGEPRGGSRSSSPILQMRKSRLREGQGLAQ